MLTTLILAAGESRRFAEKFGPHYPPKQFLEFPPKRGGDPAQMWENVVRDLTITTRTYAAFQHRHANWLRDSRRMPTAYVWLMSTRGQADTLVQALRRIPSVGELLVVNCDNGFEFGVLNRLVHEGRFHNQVAALTMQRNNEKRWSFVDGHPTFHGAAERRMLTPFALAGAYYFPSGEEALYAAEQAVDHAFEESPMTMDGSPVPVSVRLREPYISEMFKWLPDPKLSVEIDPDHFHDWGTPENLNNFVHHVTR